MASAVLWYLQSLWPLSALLKEDDLGVSARLVRTLAVPEETKQFVFALREPDSLSLIYILAAQNLSEQSALDAGHLIRAVRPKAVITQVAHAEVDDVWIEEECLAEGGAGGVPASPFQVIKRCVTEKRSKEHCEICRLPGLAGDFRGRVLRPPVGCQESRGGDRVTFSLARLSDMRRTAMGMDRATKTGQTIAQLRTRRLAARSLRGPWMIALVCNYRVAVCSLRVPPQQRPPMLGRYALLMIMEDRS